MSCPFKPEDCPRCGVVCKVYDWRSVDIGVGMQRYDPEYECPEHGIWALIRDDVADPENWSRWAEEAATVAGLAEEGFATLDAPTATPPHDGGPAMRPHGIPGWWQVWQGGICVALLRPEDVAALAEVPRG